MAHRTLPRLLYLADLPVGSTYHGSAMLYRLLEHYPVDRLRIVEAGPWGSAPNQRIKDVSYHDCRPAWGRLTETRFHGFYRSLRLLWARPRAYLFKSLVRDFRPEAILTVSSGVSFVTAAAIAENFRVPLHLICHDEWFIPFTFCNGACRQRIFGDIYRAAASQLCVSPFMVEEYERRYHVRGTVLYPYRAADLLTFAQPPGRLVRTDGEFVCAFAGTLNLEYVAALKLLAECLAPLGGRVLIFASVDPATARSVGLGAPNVELAGFLPSRSFIESLRERADVLFVPMSFAPGHRANMEVNFPSKLADYTAVGLPLLIHGPEYSSAVRWAQANAPAAEVVTQEGSEELSRAVQRLASDSARRMQLARAAIALGKRYFSYETAWATFSGALRAGVGA